MNKNDFYETSECSEMVSSCFDHTRWTVEAWNVMKKKERDDKVRQWIGLNCTR